MYTIPDRFPCQPDHRLLDRRRTKGLQYRQGGSLTIYVSNASPARRRKQLAAGAGREVQPGRARLRPSKAAMTEAMEAAAAGGRQLSICSRRMRLIG